MGGTKSEMQTCWRRLTEFLEDTGLEMNTQKTLLLSNTYATEHPSLSLKGQEIKTLTNNEPFKILGIWFTMDMDWKYQKRRAGATLIATIEKLLRHSIRNDNSSVLGRRDKKNQGTAILSPEKTPENLCPC